MLRVLRVLRVLTRLLQKAAELRAAIGNQSYLIEVKGFGGGPSKERRMELVHLIRSILQLPGQVRTAPILAVCLTVTPCGSHVQNTYRNPQIKSWLVAAVLCS